MSVLTEMSEYLQKGRVKIVKELVRKAIDEGIDANRILQEGLLTGMSVLGAKFKKNEVYVPEVLLAAMAMNAGLELLKPLVVSTAGRVRGKIVLGTVKGDVHDIGKNLVRMMMEGKGLEVIDIGVDVPAEKFIDTAKEADARIIACSALLTTSMPEIKTIIKAAEKAGIRENVTIMIGGAPITEAFCKQIGADIYTENAASAADAAAKIYETPV